MGKVKKYFIDLLSDSSTPIYLVLIVICIKKRAIAYIAIGVAGLYSIPFVMKSLLFDTIPFPLYLLIGFVGLLFYGLVLWQGAIRLMDKIRFR